MNPVLHDHDLQEKRYSRMTRLLSLGMMIISLVISSILLITKAQTEIAAFIASTTVVYLLLFFIFQNGNLRPGYHGLIFVTCLNGLVANTLIGWRSGLFVVLFLLIPVLFYNPIIKKYEKMLLSILFALTIMMTILLSFLFDPIVQINAILLQAMNCFNIFMTCAVLAGISFLDYRSSNDIADRLINVNQQLAYLASRDSLTNLLNRRTMNQFIQMEHVRSKRSGKPFGLIMADVDDFKHVNDQYGHTAGDVVLTDLSFLITSILREQDLTARWGGEEFLILLPETDLDGVQVTAEKIRDLISQSSFLYQGKNIQITLSIGGVICQNDENWDDCITHADRALYFGKSHGKNLAIFSHGENYCVLGNIGVTTHMVI